jgi:hypothetical protein
MGGEGGAQVMHWKGGQGGEGGGGEASEKCGGDDACEADSE